MWKPHSLSLFVTSTLNIVQWQINESLNLFIAAEFHLFLKELELDKVKF